MKKELSEMTLEELWQLFPISLVAHREEWALWYEQEQQYLADILPAGQLAGISHIGSTAIDAIWAKSIVDILVEVERGCDLESIKEILLQHGYIYMNGKEYRMSFNKGYTKDGFDKEVFHLHLRYAGDHDEIYFRDYLNHHREAAKEYEKLKLGLWKEYEHDRDEYSEQKTAFVCKYTAIAKAEVSLAREGEADNMLEIVSGENYVEEVKGLIIEYTNSLGRDLAFQDLQTELSDISVKYLHNGGRLLAAVWDKKVVGCIALRRIDDRTCEMKRLYVQPEYRSYQIGKKLVAEIIAAGGKMGYKRMVLDTIKPLKGAISLYRKFGFQEIPAYYDNPMDDAVYMELKLQG